MGSLDCRMAKKFIPDKAKILLTTRGMVIHYADEGGKPFRVKSPEIEKVQCKKDCRGVFLSVFLRQPNARCFMVRGVPYCIFPIFRNSDFPAEPRAMKP